MKIVTKTITVVGLTQSDLEQAITEFLGKQLTIAADAKIQITATSVGYEIRIEQETGAESSTDKAPRTRRKIDRLDPKEAMAILKEKASEPEPEVATETAPETTQEAAPVVGEEKGHVQMPSLFEKVQTAPEQPKEETAPPAETPAQTPAKAPSLFAAFKRPSN